MTVIKAMSGEESLQQGGNETEQRCSIKSV